MYLGTSSFSRAARVITGTLVTSSAAGTGALPVLWCRGAWSMYQEYMAVPTFRRSFIAADSAETAAAGGLVCSGPVGAGGAGGGASRRSVARRTAAAIAAGPTRIFGVRMELSSDAR